MKVMFVCPVPCKLQEMTMRLDLYHAGMASLGHELIVVCKSGAEVGFPCPVQTFSDFSDLADPQFWGSLNGDAILMITWMRMLDYLEAARTVGRKVIAIADSDGQISARLHFTAMLSRDWTNGSAKLAARLKLARYYLKLRLHGARRHDHAIIRSAELSERVVFATNGALRNFSRCLTYYNRNDLISRLQTAPYPIDPLFLLQDIPRSKARRAIAIGRWDDPAKNAGLLANALNRYYKAGAEWEIVIVGNGGMTYFSEVASRWTHVRLAGRLSPGQIAELLATSRVLLCPSLWESGPMVAFEALATGCTLVSTPLPTVTALIEDEKWGTLSASFHPEDFVRAMTKEFSAWDRGLRSTDSLSSHWRTKLGSERICQQLLS